MSDALVWQLVKKHSAFLHKQKGIELTKEPGNLTGRNCFRFSGLAHAHALDVSLGKDGAVYFSKKRHTAGRHPAKTWAKYKLTQHQRNGTNKAAHAIKSQSSGQFPVAYRGDLAKLAVAKYHKLFRARVNAAKQAKADAKKESKQ